MFDDVQASEIFVHGVAGAWVHEIDMSLRLLVDAIAIGSFLFNWKNASKRQRDVMYLLRFHATVLGSHPVGSRSFRVQS